jgi:hypothetical protein
VTDGAFGCASRSASRCDQPSRPWYFISWYARSAGAFREYQRPTAERMPRPQPRNALTYRSQWKRCVPVRATAGSAASAAARVTSSPRPAAIARAKSAGSFFGARPVSLISTTRRTTRGPSVARHSATLRTASCVSCRSPT